MRFDAALAVSLIMLGVPCLAGSLEDGIKLHQRKDYAGAVTAFEKAAATGNLEAQRRLGFIYYHGDGVAQDNRRAIALFEKAAAAGDIQSAINLGKMYEYGIAVEQDDQRAASWYRQGAELGDPESQFNASVMYYKGQGVGQDRSEAMKWWTIAMLAGGRSAERIRPLVESAERKLTPDQIAEGQRRASEWIKGHDANK